MCARYLRVYRAECPVPFLLTKVNKSLPATDPRQSDTEELPLRGGNRADTERKRVGKSFEKG